MIRIVVRLYKNEIPLTEEKTIKMALSKLVKAPLYAGGIRVLRCTC